MTRRLHAAPPLLLFLFLFLALALPAFGATSRPVAAPRMAAERQVAESGNWCIAGSFNDWNNGALPLNDAGTGGDLIPRDGIYSADYMIPAAGRHEWKVVACGNWELSYPARNAWLYTALNGQQVKFTFDSNDRSSDTGLSLLPARNIVNVWDSLPASFTAVGSFQGWNNTDPASRMEPVGHGIFRLAYVIPTPGSYEAKIVRTGSWADQIVAEGRQIDDGTPALSFSTTNANETVIFLYDSRKGRISITTNGNGSGNWCLAGSFQGWNNSSTPLNDSGLGGDLVGGDGVYSLDYEIPSAGRHEWKVVECGNWGTSFPVHNAWLHAADEGQRVKFTFDTNDHSGDAGAALLPARNIVNAWDALPAGLTAVGDFQGWNNTDPATALTDAGNGWHLLRRELPAAGDFNGKVTVTGSWDALGADGRSIDAANLPFGVARAGEPVQFVVDAYEGRLAILTSPSERAAHDNDVWWDDLAHDSRDRRYRTPGGPVPAGTPVRLRLRAASGDLTAARLRLWDDRADRQQLLQMARVADDGRYEWWEATVPASAEPTILWYRFIAIDGSARAYYEDDDRRTGGLGQSFGESRDHSWQLTVYDPAFETPEWVKNAVIYQIFPDRFRDGEPGNNLPADSFFYDGETITRSGGTAWHEPICDPRDAGGPCPGKWSENFYGGDLQGIIDKLDYLQGLGVTALYLNPIFESPSNHKYDTTDFSLIDDNLGDLAAFRRLADEAHRRGMRIILDGVFNHSSSDSIYFDRYGRYESVGACESVESPYRDWFYFRAVTPGTGPCVGSDGTPQAATYESWFGYDSLPKLNAHHPAVRALIWDSEQGIGRQWLQAGADGWRLDVAGDVDPGTTNDPSNDYWEGFRAAMREANPEAYIVGEEWGLATAWTLGQEWDATMNYQLGSALLSFWRDEPFTDNDHNASSSAGVLTPLSPQELDERLRNLEERYPPQAYQAMMNLLGSHDTNRALLMLDHNTDLNDRSLYEDPAYDWGDATERLKGVVLLQMTLPGAPTIYYGDEVGLVGPATPDGAGWQDDPYNRLPYPWLDESGTPFYQHLRTEAGQARLRDYYGLLAATRNEHPALRTGSFDTLLVDDGARLYAYGRLLPGEDAGLVIANRSGSSRTARLNVAGYLPFGTRFVDVLAGNRPYQVDGSGELVVTVPANGGALLVLDGPLATPPGAPGGLSATAGNGQVELAWQPLAGASGYRIYRSLLSGGGYELVAETTSPAYTDSPVANGRRYYYVVTAMSEGGVESEESDEVAAIPAYPIGWAILQWPKSISHTLGLTPTETIYGQLYVPGLTDAGGEPTEVRAQVGFGPEGSDPATWTTWSEMSYNVRVGNNYEYQGRLRPEQVGRYDLLVRFSTDLGESWSYGDQEGMGSARPGVLQVEPNPDTTPPAAPANLRVTDWGAERIDLAWEPVAEAGEYWLYRRQGGEGFGIPLVRLPAESSSYQDQEVTTGASYSYVVRAVDGALNLSAPSNEVTQRAEIKMVQVTFRVRVPEETPSDATIYVAGNIPALGPWDAGKQPMVNQGNGIWEVTLAIPDGTRLEYKYTRGSWESVENWGSIFGFTNRQVEIRYGSEGHQLVDNSATDWGEGADETKAVRFWRDPLVRTFEPRERLRGPRAPISVTFSTPVTTTATLSESMHLIDSQGNRVAGRVIIQEGTSLHFLPAERVKPGEYRVVVSHVRRADIPDPVPMQVPHSWTFVFGHARAGQGTQP